MYLRSVHLQNIRAISDFEMTFSQFEGWHVLIGDNGSGKSSIIRSIALGLIGLREISGIKPNWSDWLKWGTKEGSVSLGLIKDPNKKIAKNFEVKISLVETKKNIASTSMELDDGDEPFFSAGFGPFRRFTGGSYEMSDVFKNPSFEKLAAHLSLFGEDVALTEATNWLVQLQFQTLEKSISKGVLENLVKFINSPDFLPHQSKLKSISSQGVLFEDGNGAEISVTQMSDGYRSILSLTFELLRQMVKVFGQDRVFKKVSMDQMVIDIPGIVLIDEIDAHLHPTWQTRIGEWFTKYFPNIQFVVTTHSPLICRAAEKGSIWQLKAPGSSEASGEITGIEKEQIIFGNVLDAYGTEVFGKTPVRSQKSDEKRDRLGKLNLLSALGTIEDQEEKERLHLQKILKTDDPVSFEKP